MELVATTSFLPLEIFANGNCLDVIQKVNHISKCKIVFGARGILSDHGIVPLQNTISRFVCYIPFYCFCDVNEGTKNKDEGYSYLHAHISAEIYSFSIFLTTSLFPSLPFSLFPPTHTHTHKHTDSHTHTYAHIYTGDFVSNQKTQSCCKDIR